jgi:dipeptidyl aminopeptidase/acylaminoacyl peptidase
VAICGASYGGYAALMGAVTQSGSLQGGRVHRCGSPTWLESIAFTNRRTARIRQSYSYWLRPSAIRP